MSDNSSHESEGGSSSEEESSFSKKISESVVYEGEVNKGVSHYKTFAVVLSAVLILLGLVVFLNIYVIDASIHSFTLSSPVNINASNTTIDKHFKQVCEARFTELGCKHRLLTGWKCQCTDNSFNGSVDQNEDHYILYTIIQDLVKTEYAPQGISSPAYDIIKSFRSLCQISLTELKCPNKHFIINEKSFTCSCVENELLIGEIVSTILISNILSQIHSEPFLHVHL